jgi:hypothetical protein
VAVPDMQPQIHPRTLKTKVRLETTIEVPTPREKIVQSALEALPEVNIDRIPGWEACKEACTKLAAAEALKNEAENALRKASAEMRSFVSKTWEASEVKPATRDLLDCW